MYFFQGACIRSTIFSAMKLPNSFVKALRSEGLTAGVSWCLLGNSQVKSRGFLRTSTPEHFVTLLGWNYFVALPTSWHTRSGESPYEKTKKVWNWTSVRFCDSFNVCLFPTWRFTPARSTYLVAVFTVQAACSTRDINPALVAISFNNCSSFEKSLCLFGVGPENFPM